nr:hypothetical protein [Bradyrhizobium sp. CSA207]
MKRKGACAGIVPPFCSRMAINPGYCNVGNFGSSDCMDYYAHHSVDALNDASVEKSCVITERAPGLEL